MKVWKVKFAMKDIDGDVYDCETAVNAPDIGRALDEGTKVMTDVFQRTTLGVAARIYSVELIGTDTFES